MNLCIFCLNDMNKFILIFGLIFFSHLSEAENYFVDINYCTWIGTAANIIAQNRDLGINKNDLIKNYLMQGNDYNEQIIIIDLIDRIYELQKHNDVDMVTLQAESKCMSGLLATN